MRKKTNQHHGHLKSASVIEMPLTSQHLKSLNDILSMNSSNYHQTQTGDTPHQGILDKAAVVNVNLLNNNNADSNNSNTSNTSHSNSNSKNLNKYGLSQSPDLLDLHDGNNNKNDNLPSYLDFDSYEGSVQSDDSSSILSTPFTFAHSAKHRALHQLCSDHFSMPNRNLIVTCGEILVRTKPSCLLWRRGFASRFWVRYGRHFLLFFESKETYEQWLSSEELSSEGRKKLIIDCIDFEKDSLSHNIMGYKSTCPYVKKYRNRELHVFKVFQWRSSSANYGTLSPFLANAFASHMQPQLEKLFCTVMKMIRVMPINVHLQHNLIASDSSSGSLAHKIDQFNALEYHHEFSDWLMNVRLRGLGFIVSSQSSDQLINQQVALESIRRKNKMVNHQQKLSMDQDHT